MPFDNRDIQLCNVQIQRRRTLAKCLMDDRSLADVQMSKLTVLEKSRDKKQQKLDELSVGSAIASIKHGMILKRSEKLDNLRAEIATLTAEHRDAVNVLQAISKRIADNEAELISLKGCEDRYQELLREKKEYIIRLAVPESEELAQMDHDLQVLEIKVLALERSMISGARARDHMERLVTEINGAQPSKIPFFGIAGTIASISQSSRESEVRKIFASTPALLKAFA